MNDDISATQSEHNNARNPNPQTFWRYNPMKRYLSLGLLALALVVAMFTASPAFADTHGGITCTQVNNGGVFPYPNLWNCSGDSTKGSAIFGTLHGLGTDAQSKLTASGGQFYIFTKTADYFAYCNNNPNMNYCSNAVDLSAEVGKTFFPASPVYSIIVLNTTNPDGSLTPWPWYQNVALHEAGHQLDPLYTTNSSSTLYKTTKIGLDWAAFNNLNPTSFPQCSSTNGAAIFRNQKDQFGGWICSNSGLGDMLSAGYSGNNQSVLQKAWPYFYQPGDAAHTYNDCATGSYCELWAEQVAYQFGATRSSNQSPDNFMKNNHFQCTGWLVYKELVTGAVPTSWPVGCN